MSDFYRNRTLIVGIFEYIKYAEFGQKTMAEVVKFFGRHFKRVHFEDLSYETLSNMNFSEELPEAVDAIFNPSLMNLLTERVNGSFTAISKTLRKSGMHMITAVPRSITVASIDDVADKWTWIGIFTSLLVISFLLSIYEFHRKNSKKKLPKHKILGIFFKYVWDSTMIFFMEPFETIFKSICQRILCGVWVLASVVIISEISGAMKSSYSFVVYDNIKSADEIIPGSRWQPKLLEGLIEERLFTSLAAKEPKFKHIIDKMELFEPSDMATPDFFHAQKKEDVFFLLEIALTCGVGACFEEGVLEKEEMPEVYLSEPIMELLLVYPISYKMSKSPIFLNLLDWYLFSEFECKWAAMYLARYTFHVDAILWHPQTTESETISYEDVIPIFKLFIYGQIIAGLTLLIEIIIGYYTGKFQL